MLSLAKKTDRYNALNGLRAFSAIGIVLMHVLANGSYPLEGVIFNRLIPSFTDLVFLFMMISSFSMCCGYYEKMISRTISFEQFYIRRYSKIWPFFAVLSILELTISPSLNSIYEVFANLTLCFGFLNANIEVIGVGWFIGVTFIFYISFPFFCFLIEKKKRAFFSIIISLLLNFVCSQYFHVGRNNILYSFVFFMTGGIIYLYRSELSRFSDKYRWLILLLCIGSSVLYYLLPSVLTILILGTALLIYGLGSSRTLLDNGLTKFLSSISMEIYLSHMLFFRVLEKLNLIYISTSNVISYVFASIMVLGGTILFSWCFQKIFAFIFNRKKAKSPQ